MLEQDELIQDEREFPEQTEQLQKNYALSKADQQSLLRIRTRLLLRSVQQETLSSQVEQQSTVGMTDFEQPAIGQMLSPLLVQQIRPQQKKRVYTWRLMALVAVLCVVILSGTIYALCSSIRLSKPAGQLVASPTQKLPSSRIANILNITMTSTTTGWGMGTLQQKNNQSILSIVHTIDSGKTWQAFESSGVSSGLMTNFFLNDETAWVVMDDPHGKRVLMRTTDGGKRWTTLSMPSYMTNVAFVDQQHGWAWSFIEVPNIPDAKKMYRTTDGGETWNEIGVMSTERTIDDLTPGALPYSRGIHVNFQTTQRGWAKVHFANKQIGLYITQDGGVTWQRQILPEPATGPIPGIHTAVQEDAYIALQFPTFATPQQGVLSVITQTDMRSIQTVYIYKTEDGGQNWKPVDTSLTDKSNSYFAKVLDEKQSIFVSDSMVTVYTLENGQWQPRPAFGITGNVELGSVSFSDSQHGWFGANQISNGKNTFTLYMTKDGGLSWHEVMRSVTDASSTPAPSTDEPQVSGG